MSNYSRGRSFEYRIRNVFRKKGYLVIRSAQSKLIDLVCLKPGRVCLVECKSGSSRLRSADKNRALELARISGANYLILVRRPVNKRRAIFFNLLTMKEINPAQL